MTKISKRVNKLTLEEVGGSTPEEVAAYLNAGVQVGTIIMWWGNISSIPSGWALCDGGNGTPNLSGKFPLCVSDQYPAGSTGGGGSFSSPVDILLDGNTGDTYLTESQMPSHNHASYSKRVKRDNKPVVTMAGLGSAQDVTSFDTGGSSGHNHDISSEASSGYLNITTEPKYTVLAYIMYIGTT